MSSSVQESIDRGRLLHRGDDELLAELGDAAVAKLDDLGEVVAGVDVHEREREARRAKGLLGQAQQHDRVLATAEEQDRALELGGHLAHDVDGLGLQDLEVGELHAKCSPHSTLSVPAQRPSRPLPGWVQGAQPIEA